MISPIVIVGPTAVGKTKLSIEVAKAFQGEVISGDSMQVYKGMDIGTAKISPNEMEEVPHHLIDIRNPNESYSVADFTEQVKETAHQILNRGNRPVVAGGTGLYIQALLDDYQFEEKQSDSNVRLNLENEANHQGIEYLYERLKTIDPTEAEKIPIQNKRRIIRALEIFELTGKTKSEWNNQETHSHIFEHSIVIGLEMERAILYDRINNRVDQMVEDGLIDEVFSFYKMGYEDFQSMKGIGYKEFIPYFKGEWTKEEAIDRLKRNSRRFAKRQMTWFKNKMNVQWYSISPEHYSENFQKILYDLAGMIKEKEK